MSLKKYLTEAELAAAQPVTGDEFDISIRDITNIETFVLEHTEGSITIALDETAIKMLEHCGCTFEEDEDEEQEQVDELAPVIGAIGGALGRGVAAGAGALARGAAKAVVATGIKAAHDKLDKKIFGPKPAEGDYEYEESLNSIRKLSGMVSKETVKEEGHDTSPGSPYDRGSADSYYGRDPRPHKIVPYTGADGVKGQMQKVPLTDPAEIAAYKAGYSENDDRKDYGESVNEAEHQGRKVPLGKPMQGDVKKFKVYVKDPSTGNVKKVNFGDPNMRIKKSNPKNRKSFRARHNCKNPGPRTKARYWSCRKW